MNREKHYSFNNETSANVHDISQETGQKQEMLIPLISRHLPADTKRIYLIRHAHTADYTSMDAVLTNIGYAQLQTLQNYFKDKQLDLIVASELKRSMLTAHALQMLYADAKTLVDPALNEVHTIGNWRSFSQEDVVRLANERMYKPDHCSELAESPRLFHRRVSSALEKILQENVQNIAIVAHSGVLGVLISLAFGIKEDDETGFILAYPHVGISEIWVADKRGDPSLPDRVTIIKSMCYHDYLSPDLVTF